MFHDLDSTVAELLLRGLPPDIVQQVTISFATPDGQFPTNVTPPAINLFLYDLQENRDLRSAEPFLERAADGKVTRALPPLRVDCSYMVTAWATGVQQPEQDEHRLLGETLRVLLRHKEIPPEALRGSLKKQAYPLRAAVLQPSQNAGRAEFWQALGGKPKAAFNYTVTVGLDAMEGMDVGVPAPQPEDSGKVANVVTGEGSTP